ncbi:MAG: HAD-IG family 5'-nucleotidase [Rhodothermales bacterium]
MDQDAQRSIRGIYCNRTLNMRRIKAIGYDMDYTLIHYRMEAWEERAYVMLKRRLSEQGWPVGGLEFDAELSLRGLIIDTERGNLVKCNRFGYVKRAYHGTRPLPYEELREVYERTLVDLNEARWYFLNTLFSISEACMYLQLVDLLDQDVLPGALGYDGLYRLVRRSLDETHMEGTLKAEIVAEPDRFVDLDEDMPVALLDQKRAGKKILLITNSEWSYAEPMLRYVFDPFLPGDETWRDLFDIAIVGARKPDFFSGRAPAYEVATAEGLLREHIGSLQQGRVYVGGNARLVEESLGLRGEEILYVGDHIFVDVNISKNVLRWRTALVIRELEDEIVAMRQFAEGRDRLSSLMARKEELEAEYSRIRLALQRNRSGYGPQVEASAEELKAELQRVRERVIEVDEQVVPLAEETGRLLNSNWGLLMRAGNDKSHLARQIERYADVYTGRVSNFLHHTPFVYLRSHRGSLPHDE